MKKAHFRSRLSRAVLLAGVVLGVVLFTSCGGTSDNAPAGSGSNTGALLPLLPAVPSAPSAPTAVIAVAGDANNVLSWNASPGAVDYTVFRSTTDGGPYATAATVAGTTYADTALANGTRYFYVVRANNAIGSSGNSTQARSTPVAAPAAGTVRWPLSSSTAVDSDGIRFQYGARRFTNYDFHAGVDIPAPAGTPIYPVMNGVVTARVANWTIADGDGPGNYVLVNHGNQMWTAYLHMSAVTAQVGDNVVAGVTELGKVGMTGANSNHLHFTYMVGLVSEATSESRSKNPLEILPHVPLPDTPPYVPVATFRTDGSNTVDISMPSNRMTMRWAILMGGGQTRMIDYYEIVSQGSGPRNNQNQPAAPGLTIDATTPVAPDPAARVAFTLSLRPNPVSDFTVTRVILKDFNGRTILDATKP